MENENQKLKLSFRDVFKIKNENSATDVVKGVREAIFDWSEKYKLAIEKVEGKETYYITGRI